MSLSAVELWNQNAFLAINAGAQAPAYAIAVARVLANWSIYLAIMLLISAWVRRGRAIRYALLDAGFVALTGLGIAQGIVAVWYHPRPFEIGLGHQYLAHAAEASFPSDHATLLFSLGLALLIRPATRSLGVGLLLLGGVVAWARVYLGVHFPLDMLGAFGVALVATWVIGQVEEPLHRRIFPLFLSAYETVLRRLGLPRSVFPRDL